MSDEKEEDKNNSNDAYKQAGGHEGNVVFDGNKMTKTTKLSEVENYERIFKEDTKFQKFLPHFYEATKNKDGVCHMTSENLLYGRENASYMDIKLGTSSCTLGASDEKKQHRLETDEKRCTAKYGYTIVGCKFKNPETGDDVEITDDATGKAVFTGKIHPPTPEASKPWLEALFSQKPNRDDTSFSVDTKGIQYVLSQLENILNYFQNDNTYTIRGMSLFIVVDSHKQEYLVKLIDLVSMDPTGTRDEGLIKGCQSLMELLEEINNKNEKNGDEGSPGRKKQKVEE